MDALNMALPVILYVCGIIALIVLIILGIRLIQVVNKVDNTIDEYMEKLSIFTKSLGSLTKAAAVISKVGDKAISGLTTAVSKVFNKKDKEEEEDYYD